VESAVQPPRREEPTMESLAEVPSSNIHYFFQLKIMQIRNSFLSYILSGVSMFYLHGKAEERPPVSSLLQALLLYVHQVRTP
jgi:hypothetical protein